MPDAPAGDAPRVSGWVPRWPTNGSLLHVRVSASLLGKVSPWACPEHLATNAHPEVFPRHDRYVANRYHRFATFALGMVRDAVRDVETGRVEAGPADPLPQLAARAVASAEQRVKRDVHPAARTWARHAVETYLETCDELAGAHRAAGGSPLLPDGTRAIAHHDGDLIREVTVWGLGYVSGDGRVREFRTLRLRSAIAARPRPTQEVAVLAYVTAFGARVLEGDGPYRDPLGFAAADPVTDREPDRVRIVDVGLTDATSRLLWEGTPAQAQELFTGVARPLVPKVTDGGHARPQRACADCKARVVCEALPKRPGLLGLPNYGTHPRVLAPSKLWTYQVCPAKYLLTTDLRLPAAPTEQTESMLRGSRVHRWLEHAHFRGIACSGHDLPDPTDPTDLPDRPDRPDLPDPPDPTDLPDPADATGARGSLTDSGAAVAAAAELSVDDVLAVRPWLAQHLAVCPFTTVRDIAGYAPERDVVVDDTDADVLVVTRPDLLLATPSGPVWRETKTVTVMPTLPDVDLLSAFPQVAVGVCALADAAITEAAITDRCGPGAGVVELELLTTSGARLVRYDATDETVVLAARRSLAEQTYPWHQDDEFPTRPGTACAFCEVNRWCPDADADPVGATVMLDGHRFDTATGELLDEPATTSVAGLGLAASVLGGAAPAGGDDEDIPF